MTLTTTVVIYSQKQLNNECTRESERERKRNIGKLVAFDCVLFCVSCGEAVVVSSKIAC